MKRYTVELVRVEDVLPQTVLDSLDEGNLPWRFGDCTMSAILPRDLLDWADDAALADHRMAVALADGQLSRTRMASYALWRPWMGTRP
jgi:hypothetical protein